MELLSLASRFLLPTFEGRETQHSLKDLGAVLDLPKFLHGFGAPFRRGERIQTVQGGRMGPFPLFLQALLRGSWLNSGNRSAISVKLITV
jgi:hypothetical protein